MINFLHQSNITHILTLFFISLSSHVLSREIKAKYAKEPIVIDGITSAAEWPIEFFQTNFTQMEPQRGMQSTEITKVAIQYDAENIYVAFDCEKSYQESIIAKQTRRDQLEKKDDVVAVIFDTYHDSRSAYWFMANALNTQVDARLSDDGKYIETEWDTRWQVKSRVNENNWTVEFAIPLKSIRFNPSLKTWGVNFGRFVPYKLETSYWAGATDSDYRVSSFGTLTGLEISKLSSEYRIIPYTNLRHETFTHKNWKQMFGVDLEYRYQNNITGNLTYNPDFATVEGDKEKINMTRWELSFPEKRKFFLEGNELFQNRILTFYSRRIGEINWGGKVTGKTGLNTFSVIGLNAKKVKDNPQSTQNEYFPQYNIGIFRLKRDVLKSSTIGVLFIDKEWSGGYTRVLSLDGVFHLPAEFHFTTQFVLAKPGSLLKNYGGFVRLARENNIYHYHLRYTELSENFRASVNSVGFINDDDRRELDSDINYKWWVNRHGIEFINYQSNYNIYWSKRNGTLKSWQTVHNIRMLFQNKFSLSSEYKRQYHLFEKNFYNYDFLLSVGYNTEQWSATEISYQWGFNFDRHYWMLIGQKKLKINNNFSIEYEIRNLTFDPDPANESTWLNITTLNYQFTPDLFIRFFAQNRTTNKRIYVYGILGWRFKLPNSAVYFVYTRDDFNQPYLPREKSELFFLKFAYDFHL